MLLISEDLREFRVTYRCQSCGKEEAVTLKGEIPRVRKCPGCGSNMTVAEKKDIVDEYYDLAEAGGTEVFLVSTDTEEGEMLLRAFGGVAAVLRYRMNNG